MWRDKILGMEVNAVFHASATAEQLSMVETLLGIELPGDLTSLLRETNGVEVAYGVNLIWSTQEIAENNSRLRRECRIGGEMGSYMPVDHLLFFGEAGNGDLYAFPITAEGVRHQVFVWDHEDDSRTCQSPSLERWLTQQP